MPRPKIKTKNELAAAAVRRMKKSKSRKAAVGIKQIGIEVPDQAKAQFQRMAKKARSAALEGRQMPTFGLVEAAPETDPETVPEATISPRIDQLGVEATLAAWKLIAAVELTQAHRFVNTQEILDLRRKLVPRETAIAAAENLAGLLANHAPDT